MPALPPPEDIDPFGFELRFTSLFLRSDARRNDSVLSAFFLALRSVRAFSAASFRVCDISAFEPVGSSSGSEVDECDAESESEVSESDEEDERSGFCIFYTVSVDSERFMKAF